MLKHCTANCGAGLTCTARQTHWVAAYFTPPSPVAQVYTGKVLGCLASFLLGRTVLQETCKRCLSSNELFRAFDLAVSREPYTVCFLARASYVPISLKNYGFAVLSVPSRAFVLALVLVEVLNSSLLVLIGSTAGSLSGRGDDATAGGGSDELSRVPMVVGSLGLVALAIYISVATRRALAEMRANSASAKAIVENEVERPAGTRGKSRASML